MKNEICPNMGIAELLNGPGFTDTCCQICKKDPTQHECIKACVAKGTFSRKGLKKQKGKEKPIFRL